MKKSFALLISCALLAVVSRLLPEAFAGVPLLLLALLGCRYWSKKSVILTVLCSALVSDGLLARWQDGAWLGDWTAWVYSGLLLLVLGGYLARRWQAWPARLSLSFIASLGFWAWTNLGCWFSGMYAPTADGLLRCYVMALPFLPVQLLMMVALTGLILLLERSFVWFVKPALLSTKQ